MGLVYVAASAIVAALGFVLFGAASKLRGKGPRALGMIAGVLVFLAGGIAAIILAWVFAHR